MGWVIEAKNSSKSSLSSIGGSTTLIGVQLTLPAFPRFIPAFPLPAAPVLRPFDPLGLSAVMSIVDW